jgi:outer membrane receptor protein involved in Fe transport
MACVRNRLAALLIACLLWASPALAQGSAGEISGTVRDEQKGVLPGVTLTLTHQGTGVARTAATEADGRYLFAALSPGRYALLAELAGFAAQQRADIEITVGLGLVHDFTLGLAGVREVISVHAPAPVVDTTKAEVAAVVTQRQIETLPINSRQYLSLALLMPGTSLDSTRSFFPTVNVGGSMTFNSTGNYVDGVINNFAEDGEPRQNLPQDAVEEFKITQMQYKAEFGLATAGIIQVVTKSGRNDYHGNAFEYFRDKSLNARNPFESAKPDFRRHQYGASAGGPVRRNRMHFFGAVERTSVTEFFTVRTGQPQFYAAFEGTFPRPFERTMYFGRGDWQISNTQNAFVRFAREDEKSTCSGCGGINAANNGFDQETPRRSVVMGHTWIRGARQLNDVRFQYATAGYFISPAGSTSFKQGGAFPAERLNRQQLQHRFPSFRWGSGFDEIAPESRWQFKDTYALGFTKHDVKFGVDLSYMPYIEDAAQNFIGLYTFSRDQRFDPADPSSLANLTGATTFSASLPAITTERPTKYYAAFVQDDWRPRPNVTVNLGLRWERLYGCCNEDLDPSIFPIQIPYIDVSKRGDLNNWGPRTGVAWDLRSDGRTVIRGGWGMYYGHVRILQSLNEFRNYKRFSVSISNPSYPDPYGGRDPLTFVSTAPANITVVANDYVQPYSHQMNASISRRLPWDLSVHLDAVYTRTEHDRKTLDINPRNVATGQRPNPTFARVDRLQSTGSVRYRALYLRVDRRFTQRSQFQVSYTYTNSRDNNPGGDNPRYLDPFDLDLDWGPSNGERRHALVGSGSVLLPYDITFGAIWTYRSQLPWSAVAGTDRNGDGFTSDLVPGTTRNAGSRGLGIDAVNAWRASRGLGAISESQIDSSRVSIVDLRLSKRIALPRRTAVELAAQMFNALNTKNLQDQYGGGRVATATSNSFGRIQTARPGRQAELAVRFIW